MKNLINTITKDVNTKRQNELKAIKGAIEFKKLTYRTDYIISIQKDNKEIYISAILTTLQSEKPIEKQRELLTKKVNKYYDNKLTEQLYKIELVEKAQDFTDCTINVEWARGSMQSMQAQAEMLGIQHIQGSKTGGCGYDKESTAIADVLKQCKPFMKLLYTEKNKLKNIKMENKEIFGYGSGYGLLPYFEGGVGANCLYKICENIGLKFEQIANTKNSNVYKISKGV